MADTPPSPDPGHELPGSRVTLAVATYRRPDMLGDLLPHLLREAGSIEPPARVVVVDNDPEGGARPVVEPVAPSVRYVHEPRPGIAAARNAALDAALAQASGDTARHALVFLDDDETPLPGWLAALVRHWRTSSADAVVGPVISEVPPKADSWVRASGAFSRRRVTTGTPVATAATNNLLLDVGSLAARGIRFDDRFGLTGGSDTLLTRQLVAAGGRIEWCDEAVVTETVPSARATRGWVLRRKRRSGNVTARVALETVTTGVGRARVRATLTTRACARIVRGLLLSGLALVRSDVATRAHYECDVASGLGLLSGLYGHRVTEYLREG